MKVRATLAPLVCGAVLALGVGFAQTGPETPDTAKVRDQLKLQEQKLQNQFKDFEDQLHRLKRRLSASKDPDDRAKAELLERVIEKARDESIIIQFEQINAALKDQKLTNVSDLKLLLEKTNKLAIDLQELLALMREDPNYNRAREEAKFYKELLAKLEQAIKDQRDTQLRTDLGKARMEELKAAQDNVNKAVGEIAKAIENKGKGAEGGEGKDLKGESKAGEGKGDGKSGESKDGGEEGKAGESKGMEGGEGGEGKDGEGQEGAAKGSEGKAGEGAEGKSKSGEGAEGMGGDSKSGAEGEGASDAKGGAGKEGDKREGGAKDGGEKSAVKEKQKPGEAKPGETPKDDKSGEAKSGEGAEAKGGEAKSGEGGEGKAESKEGSQGGESKGDSKGGESSDGKGSPKSGGGESGEGSPSGAKGGPQDDQKGPDQIGKKQVQDAEGYGKSAEEKIAGEDRPAASDDQTEVIKNLEEAKKKLEDLLRQAREEELERLLAALQARCEKMLAMQIRVYNETVDINKVVQTHADKKPDREDKIRSLRQAKEEHDIIQEATKAIQMLESEGTAVAFPEVFQQVREDMKIVHRRLEVADVGEVTQAVEQDIIDTLREMVDALKKAREENKDKGKDGKPGDDKGQQADQKLLDQIAELKMIRAMQVRVNNRTITYGRMYVERDGEQARDPNIRRELRDLSERQERITEVTGRIAKGDNR